MITFAVRMRQIKGLNATDLKERSLINEAF
ncbi:hypothetical protein MMC2321_01193 [Chitinophaga sp. MM2321]